MLIRLKFYQPNIIGFNFFYYTNLEKPTFVYSELKEESVRQTASSSQVLFSIHYLRDLGEYIRTKSKNRCLKFW